MEDGRIRHWETVKVTYENPYPAPISGGSAVSLALLVLGSIVKGIDHPRPSLTCVPDQRVAEMLTARRNKWGMIGKVSGIIYRECLVLLHSRISFCHVPSSHRIHLDPLVNTEEEGRWLTSRLGRGYAADSLNDECYINDDVGLLSFENICSSHHFDKSWSWTGPDQDHKALEPLGQSVLSHRLSLAHAQRDLVRLDRVGFDATVAEERSRWAFSTVRGSAICWG